jgi:hypothetical protein
MHDGTYNFIWAYTFKTVLRITLLENRDFWNTQSKESENFFADHEIKNIYDPSLSATSDTLHFTLLSFLVISTAIYARTVTKW